MLRIKRSTDHLKIPYRVGDTGAALATLDHFRVRMFRIDLYPEPIVEITLERISQDDTTQPSPLTQFLLRGKDAEALMDKPKFAKFIDHLEDIAELRCPVVCEKVK